MKKLSVLSVLILTLNFVFGNEIPLPIQDRINAVNFIFEGKVINSEAYFAYDGAYIHTSNTVEITRILKGDIQCGTIEIITNGGLVGNEELEVSHSLQLIEGSTGIFLCTETDAPTSIVDFYPETNLEKLEATFENQSFIRYWWDGQGINAADIWMNYDSLAALYNATEVITGLTFIDCSASSNLIYNGLPTQSNIVEEKEEIFPTYTKSAFDSLIDYAEYKRVNFTRESTSRSPDKIFFNLKNLIISGNTQKYLEFDITVKDNIGTKYLDQSAIRLEYDPTIFGTYIVANTNILVTSGTLNSDTNCYSLPTPADANSNTILIPALESMGSTCKVPILTTAQTIMHIKMKLQNCNIPNNITLQDTATFFGPSLIINYCAYAESPADSFQTYYTELEHTQTEPVPDCVPTITSFAPHSVAGGIKDTLTIRGFQFGDNRGSGNLYFPNANNLGNPDVFLDALDYISWSDTMIQIRVPSFDTAMVAGLAEVNQPAGSGFFKLVTDDGSSDFSDTSLTIRYSLNNNAFKNNVFIAPHAQFNGAIVFHCDTAVANYKNGAMKDIIRKALADWTCLTGIDWSLGSDTVYNGSTTKFDSACIIKFSALSPGIIATGAQRATQQPNGAATFAFAKEMDIDINSMYNYFCDSTSSTVPSNEKDLYYAILHELGHTHGLNHVIDVNAIMHPEYTPMPRKTNLEFDYSCDEGGHWIINKSQLFPSSTYSSQGASKILANPNPPCSHYVSIIEYEDSFVEMITYPNPFHDNINISLKTESSFEALIKIYDLSGKLIKSQNEYINQGENVITLSMGEISNGMYIINISSSDNKFSTFTKIIRE
jgi:hypothetical protein